MESNNALEDAIVRKIHEIFDGLPKKFKPRDGEWVTLSAIIVVHSGGETHVVSLATGIKCLPMKAVQTADGTVLHDWHAETVAIRAFNRYLIDECHKLATDHDSSSLVIAQLKSSSPREQPFAIRDDIEIIMYCSDAPCGDASMEIVMEAQKDDTPWSNCEESEESPSSLLGRGSFDKLGRVRRKPARADSPLSLSKSCSDKIALKQCTSLLSGVTSLLLSPTNAYVNTLIIPSSQYRSEACRRAFGASGRMQSLNGSRWPGGYTYCPFEVKTTDVEFVHSRRRTGLLQWSKESGDEISLKGSNVTAVWSAPDAFVKSPDWKDASQARSPLLQIASEVLIKGRLQGWKEADPRGASRVSRKKTWQAVAEVYAGLSILAPPASTYEALKLSDALKERRVVKAEAKAEALKGWIPNTMDDFAL